MCRPIVGNKFAIALGIGGSLWPREAMVCRSGEHFPGVGLTFDWRPWRADALAAIGRSGERFRADDSESKRTPGHSEAVSKVKTRRGLDASSRTKRPGRSDNTEPPLRAGILSYSRHATVRRHLARRLHDAAG